MSSCVLDTDVVIAALDKVDGHHSVAARVVRAMVRDDVALVLSVINYAETLVRPAQDERAFRAAVRAIDALGIELVAATPAIARDAARIRGLGVTLADGFAMATARARGASLASFDHRVRRALTPAGIELAPALR